jgi:hypothetical protein
LKFGRTATANERRQTGLGRGRNGAAEQASTPEHEPRVWVVEAYNGKAWWPAETVGLRPAVYQSRADARRDIYNLQVVGYRLRVRSYYRSWASR